MTRMAGFKKKGMVYVLDSGDLQKLILDECYRLKFVIHPRIPKCTKI